MAEANLRTLTNAALFLLFLAMAERASELQTIYEVACCGNGVSVFCLPEFAAKTESEEFSFSFFFW